MKRLSHLMMTVVLCLALYSTTFAGDIETTLQPPPPTSHATTDTTTGNAPDTDGFSMTEIAISVALALPLLF